MMEAQETAGSAEQGNHEVDSSGVPSTSSITDDEIAAAVRVLEAVAKDDDLWNSKRCRLLRKAAAPVSQKLQSQMFEGRNANEYQNNLKRKRAEDTIRNALKLQDKQLLEKTKLRAGRMQKLKQLAESNGADVPRLLDGVATEEGDAARMSTPQAQLTDAVDDDAASAGPSGAGDSDSVDGSSSAPEGQAAGGAEGESGSGAGARPTKLHYPRACYTCKRRFTELHHFYDTLCPTCADLNWAKRNASADLRGRIALVTGARVKIGFHCCLKLLRAGAAVIATTRFPHDAATRFAALPDFPSFSSRLHIFGLDLRDLPSTEAFCAALMRDYPHLDIMVNNACQTVRRPPQYYAPLMPVESTPVQLLPAPARPLVEANARFQEAKQQWMLTGHGQGEGSRRAIADGQGEAAGASSSSSSLPLTAPPHVVSALSSAEMSQLALVPGDDLIDRTAFPKGAQDVNKQQVDLRTHNSWTALAHQVSTPELAEVMAINAIAPFVLCAKLKPLMMRGTREQDEPAGWAQAQAGAASSSGPVSVGTGAPMSLAEAMLQAQGHGQDEDKEDEAGTGGKKRGHDVGGAAKRPRRDVAGGAMHGEAAVHRVPSWRARFIVNVSSMEGKFYRAKEATHPHTNMAKAALNMLTRTSAREYAEKFIYMTAVDTGWINEENPLEKAARTAARHNFATPLDEVDAAARILDPVFAPLAQAQAGDGTCQPQYGAFLKDYFATEW